MSVDRGKSAHSVRRQGRGGVVKVETEAPAGWREPPVTATPSTLGGRASPRLCSQLGNVKHVNLASVGADAIGIPGQLRLARICGPDRTAFAEVGDKAPDREWVRPRRMPSVAHGIVPAPTDRREATRQETASPGPKHLM